MEADEFDPLGEHPCPENTEPASPAVSQVLGLERVVFFSDAVMAIAITLLAVNIRVPETTATSALTELPSRLSAMIPQALSFVISFVVIGVYWMSQYRCFRFIKTVRCTPDTREPVVFLFIAALPFFSNLLGAYAAIPIAQALYALVVAGIGLSPVSVWSNACHGHRLVGKELDPRFIRGTFPLAVSAPITFLV